jgi:opacity protein-like surface antigen
MKFNRILVLLALALFAAPTLLAADFGLRAGRYNDSDQEFVGAELFFPLGAVNFNPNVEYLLEDDVTAGTANLDLTFDVLSTARVRPYIGAGVGLAYLDDDFGDTQTDILGNLIGGIAFDLQTITPYAQVKYFRVLDDDEEDAEDDIAFTIGLRF